jgi:hypothetical protein
MLPSPEAPKDAKRDDYVHPRQQDETGINTRERLILIVGHGTTPALALNAVLSSAGP